MKTDSSKARRVSRRRFLAGSGAALGAPMFVPRHALGGPGILPPSSKLNVAMIGCGGRGWDNLGAIGKTENIVALCDIDDLRAARANQSHPEARVYADYREALDREKDLHAVVVSTPDHMHAPIAVEAMRRGLHVYCEKPLTHSIGESRVMRRVARETGVVTQMGNGGMASETTRRSIEVIRAGALGDIAEIHIWSDRPIWPQGLDRPAEIQTPPDSVHWDLWLGVAPERPFHAAYQPFNWRGWYDFGTGAIGDIACHAWAMAYYALELGQPSRVEARTSPLFAETFPSWSVVRFEFPARGSMPPCSVTWYDGGQLPPAELLLGAEVAKSGTLVIGSKGRMLGGTLLPVEQFAGYEGPAPSLPRVEGHHEEWIAACKGQAKTMSNFDFAAQLTEAVLVGNLAIRANQPIEWDSAAMRATNCPAADAWIRREYRGDYSL